MTLNQQPYEEYKGWYIAKGITMPAQGIFEWNIYSTLEKCVAEEPDAVVDSVEEAKQWIDEEIREHELAVEFAESEAETLEQFKRERGLGPLWEQVKHGSYVIFTNISTGETKQFYNANPPDSSEVVSAAMMLKPYLETRWGEGNVKFEITAIPEGE